MGLGGGNFDPTNEHLASKHDLHKIPRTFPSIRNQMYHVYLLESRETSYRSVVIPFVVPHANHVLQSVRGSSPKIDM